MQAITVDPLRPNSIELREVSEPPEASGALLVEAIALGVCATDREIIAGDYGEAPEGAARLILGHESLGRVLQAPDDCALQPGDHVVGIVRHPDPVPCPACASGQWDMCRNGQYTEHGIKGLNGFGAERWRIEPDFAVKIGPALGLNAVLMEPASVVSKAWDHAHRLWRLAEPPHRVLVTGAGPIGLLTALFGKQRGLDVHVYDRNKDGPKPQLTAALGATYHGDALDRLASRLAPDIIIECTGAPAVIAALLLAAPDSLICLTGVGSPRKSEFDIGRFNRNMVLNNGTVFGTVNANRRHYAMAADALMRADRAWLSRLITRRVPLARYAQAYEHRKGDIKVVVEFKACD